MISLENKNHKFSSSPSLSKEFLAALLSPSAALLLMSLPLGPMTSEKADENVDGKSIYQPNSLMLLLVPNLISLKLTLESSNWRLQNLKNF